MAKNKDDYQKLLDLVKADKVKELACMVNADPKAINAKDNCGRTLLHYAAESKSVKSLKYLLDHGAEINAKDKWDFAPIHYAALSNSLVLKILIAHNSRVNDPNMDKDTPFTCASKHGYLENIKAIFVSGGNLMYQNSSNRNAYLEYKHFHCKNKPGADFLDKCKFYTDLVVQTFLGKSPFVNELAYTYLWFIDHHGRNLQSHPENSIAPAMNKISATQLDQFRAQNFSKATMLWKEMEHHKYTDKESTEIAEWHKLPDELWGVVFSFLELDDVVLTNKETVESTHVSGDEPAIEVNG